MTTKVKELYEEAVAFINGESSEPVKTLHEPVYEHPPSKPFSHHYTIPLPLRIRTIEPVNLRATLANVNYALAVNLGLEIDALSLLLNRLREKLTQKPLLTDTRSFFVYGALLKRLSQFFYNTNSAYFSYFDAANPDSVSAVLYEYMNVLLFTALRFYADINAREDWTVETGAALSQCRLVLEELVQCARFAQREPFQDMAHTNHWLYQPSPQAIGNNSGAAELTASLLQRDKARLWRHIEESLGGVAHLEALVSLTEANINEVRAQVWQEKAEEEPQLLYDCFAPTAHHVSELYSGVAQKLAACADSRLLWYAKFQSLFWSLKAELALVEYEAEQFQSGAEDSDFVECGRSALKRAQQVLRLVAAKKNKTALAIAMDRSLKADYDSMVTRVQVLHGELQDTLVGAYGYNAELVSLRAVAKWEEPPRKPGTYKQLAGQHLAEYARDNDPAGTLERAFQSLEELYTRDRSLNSVSVPVVAATSNTKESTMSNAERLGHLQERKLCYEWLVSLRDPDTGTVTVSVSALEAELAVIRRGIQAHALTEAV